MRKRMPVIGYRALRPGEICRELFQSFDRRQEVTKCWRRVNGTWTIQDAPFIDDWTEGDYRSLVDHLRGTILAGGFVYGAFRAGELKGFVSVEPGWLGGEGNYLDLSELHVSAELRGQGIGRTLFLAAKEWAREKGAKRLYLSAHSAVESQAFYRAMGCVEAEVYDQRHVEKEPYDCQMECAL